MERSWRIVIPLRLSDAKTRLSTQTAPRRRALVIAMALDVISAATHCPLVGDTVLVADQEGLDAAAAAGARAVLDPGLGLNAAIRAGAADAPGPVAALLADVPCATPDLISLALSACTGEPAIISDAEGIGTTLLAAGDAVPETQVSLHVYDADPGKRFVFLNGQRLREGDVAANGLRVERIDADGVVLDHRGSDFKVPLEP